MFRTVGPGCSFTVVGAGAAVWNGVPPARQFPFPLVQTTESNLRDTGVYNRSSDGGRWVQVAGHTGVRVRFHIIRNVRIENIGKISVMHGF